MTHLNCPHCSAELEAEDIESGTRVDCPECGNAFMVPMPAPLQHHDVTMTKAQARDKYLKIPLAILILSVFALGLTMFMKYIGKEFKNSPGVKREMSYSAKGRNAGKKNAVSLVSNLLGIKGGIILSSVGIGISVVLLLILYPKYRRALLE